MSNLKPVTSLNPGLLPALKHYGLFADRLPIEKPERSPEEVRELLETRVLNLGSGN